MSVCPNSFKKLHKFSKQYLFISSIKDFAIDVISKYSRVDIRLDSEEFLPLKPTLNYTLLMHANLASFYHWSNLEDQPTYENHRFSNKAQITFLVSQP